MSQYSFRPVRSKAAYQLMSQGWIPRLPSIAEKTRGFFIKQASYQVWNMEDSCVNGVVRVNTETRIQI
ncbi:hypothetical protein CK203_021776 [Vitis vinifera]|uniref:Uncharacterized protein n=1 Tax=Vitis vinifera TaxID=29760 RepID=A0A438J4Q0_VITVI|nr:hypothetical protein CK203_021776 [Vitis vinifera]